MMIVSPEIVYVIDIKTGQTNKTQLELYKYLLTVGII
jgi:hypothetical protein